ncbi:hypothetical protein [Novosphingobium lentum]|uniref:hypothetical protein n=1 Tax=Novosphingobium lentum TaxID=145287 RepID=UPI000832E4A2|nr:hypothetical protein [Novosphingobium lentum]
MAGKYLRGALIAFTETFPLPIPNVVIFQYNPETMTHGWTVATTAPAAAGTANQHVSQLAVSGPPVESFNFTLAMDSSDTIADGSAVTAGLAEISGVYSRLAALEMLMFPLPPPGGGLIGSVSSALGITAAAPSRSVPSGDLPLVLFVWGPGRIVPVRVTSFSVTEKLYDSILLNPTHAEAQIGLRVLAYNELSDVSDIMKPVAQAASKYSQGLREALAIANLANAADSILGMLPI